MQQAPSYETSLDLIARRKWLILVFGFIGAALGWLIGTGSREDYTAKALLLINPYTVSALDYSPASTNFNAEVAVLDTQIQFLRSAATLDRTVAALAAREDMSAASPQALRRFVSANLTVRRAASADIIEVAFTAQTPKLAADVANEVAQQFLQAQRDAKLADLQRVGDAIEARVGALAELAEAAERAVREARNAAEGSDPADQEILSRTASSLESSIATLNGVTTGSDLASVMQTVDSVQTSLSTALADLDEVQGSDAPPAEGARTSTLLREAEVKASLHREMLKRLLEVRELGYFVTDDARILDPALPPTTSSSLPPAFIAVMGYLTFLILGALLAMAFVPRRDDAAKWT